MIASIKLLKNTLLFATPLFMSIVIQLVCVLYAIYYYEYRFALIIILVVVAASLLAALAAGTRGRKLYATALALPALFAGMQLPTNFVSDWINETIVPKVFEFKLGRLNDELADCKATAIPIGNRGAIAVCGRYDRGDDIYAIVYDSSDEISDPNRAFSSEWERASELMKGKAPFGIIGYQVHAKVGHFYEIVFDQVDEPARF